jgi:hypothetical protein
MALGRLPQIGLTAYNGYIFPSGETIETLGYTVKTLWDSARRTVWACEFTITLRWTIASTSTTDSEVERMVAKLTQAAAPLEYQGRGFGDWDVNVTNVRDVDNGPRPISLDLKPVGAGKATEATWTVTFVLPTCDDARYDGIREFNFTVSYDTDGAGYSTRTYDAVVKIAQTRNTVAARVPHETADEYYEQIAPALMPGFRPVSRRRELSEDRNTLKVTFVDAQMPPHVPPFGIITASIEHTYASQPGTYGFKWNGSFAASYEVARRDGVVLDAITDFLDIAKARIADAAKMRLAVGGGGAIGAPIGERAIIPIAFSATENDVYGRTAARFTMTYFIAGVKLDQILRHGGLWKEWRSDWKAWITSIPFTTGPRGHAVLAFRPNDDKIVDLCAAVAPTTPRAQKEPPAKKLVELGAKVEAAAADAMVKAFPSPKPGGSWLSYHCFVTLSADTGRVSGHTLPTTPLLDRRQGAVTWDVTKPLPSNPQSHPFPPLSGLIGGTSQSRSQSGGETFVHQRTRPALRMTLHGHAVRVGYEIPMPEIISVNGKRPTLVGTPRFTQGVVGEALYPIYGANWSLDYLFTEAEGLPAGAIGAPQNPVLG